MRLKTIEVEIAVANYFDYRRNLIVPNISWGMNLHECDVLILTPSGYLKEVEIKVSTHDLIKDLEKKHNHLNAKIKELYFAIPEKLLEHIHYIPERAGILIAERIEYPHYSREKKKIGYVCHKERKATPNNAATQATDEDRLLMLRLAALRIWGLKEKLALASRLGSPGESKEEKKTKVRHLPGSNVKELTRE